MDRSLASRYFALPWIGLVLSCLFSTPLSAEMFSMELQKEGRQAERLSTIRQLDGPPGSVLRIASEAGTDFEFTLDRVLRRRSGIKVFSGIAENGARLALVLGCWLNRERTHLLLQQVLKNLKATLAAC